MKLGQNILPEEYKSNKRLDFSTPAPSTNDPSYATSSSEIGELHYFHNDENMVEQLSRIKMTRQRKLYLILNG